MDLLIVSLVVGAAVAYIGKKAWEMFQPGAKAGGCSCGSPSNRKTGCSGCPLVKP
jgi:hypothetical protein